MSVYERTDNDAAIVVEFNDAINRRDLLRLTELMTPEHRFIDSTGTTVSGRDACMNAWQGFFASFPDYRNIFDDVVDTGTGIVEVRGRSVCSSAQLDGPATWRAQVLAGRIALWQVFEPPAGDH